MNDVLSSPEAGLAQQLTPVLLESPYAAPSAYQLSMHLDYARAAMAACLRHGEAPMASHLLYTQPGVLDDTVAAERRLGVAAGLAWLPRVARSVVFVDHGISSGMAAGIAAAEAAGVPVQYRVLDDEGGFAVLTADQVQR